MSMRNKVMVGSLLVLFGTAFMGCGSSADLSGSAETGGGGASTVALTAVEAGNAANLPVVTEPEDGTIVMDCTDILTADPLADYIALTCETDSASAVYIYYCAAGVVTREIDGSDDDAVTLFPVSISTCSSVEGVPVITEQEFIAS